MSDHLSLIVDRLEACSAPDNSVALPSSSLPGALQGQSYVCGSGEGILSQTAIDHRQAQETSNHAESTSVASNCEASGALAECRICQEEDKVVNLESPCACRGSLKFAHRKCVQHWCNEKGDTLCEICQQPYESGYTVPPQPLHAESISVHISANRAIAVGQGLDRHEPRLLAVAAEPHFLETDYDEYARENASSAACFRSAALVLMALLLLRHILSMTAAAANEDASTFYMLFLLRAAGFLLPCYIMVRAMNVLQRRRQQQEVAMAAAEVAYLLQTGQARGVRFAISPEIAV